MVRKLALLMVVAMLILVPVGSAMAQGDWPPAAYCGDLSEEDCAILVASQDAMMDLYANAFDMSMNISMEMDDPEFESFAFGMNIAGAAEVDMDALAPLMEMSEAYSGEAAMTDMMENMAELVPQMLEGLTGVLATTKGNVLLEIELPEGMLESEGAPFDQLPAIDLRMVDGVIYFNLGAFVPEEEAAGMPAWMGVDLVALVEGIGPMLTEEMMMDDMPDMAEMEGMMMDPSMFAQFADPAFLDEVVTVTRLEDEEVDGQAVAVFETTVDYAALFSSEAFLTYMDEYMAMMSEMQGMDMQEELPENFWEAMGTLMDEVDYSMVQWIGVEDFYMYKMSFGMDMNMNFAELAAAMPELAEEGDMDDAPEYFAMSMEMVLEQSAFNEPVEVVVPEGAQVIDPMMFMGMAGDSY